jgi:hypothetical protein
LFISLVAQLFLEAEFTRTSEPEFDVQVLLLRLKIVSTSYNSELEALERVSGRIDRVLGLQTLTNEELNSRLFDALIEQFLLAARRTGVARNATIKVKTDAHKTFEHTHLATRAADG